MTSTTALLRRIEREKQQAAQAERDERLAVARGEAQRQRRPVWAVDHLMRVGAISPDAHAAADRYMRARATVLSLPVAGFSAERVDSGCADPHLRQLDRARKATFARTVHSHVLRRLSSRPAQLRASEALFAFPLPTMRGLRGTRSGSEVERVVVAVVEAVAEAVEFAEGAEILQPLKITA